MRSLATLTCTVLRACLPKIPLPISTTMNPIHFELPTTAVLKPDQEDPLVSQLNSNSTIEKCAYEDIVSMENYTADACTATLLTGPVALQALNSDELEQCERSLTIGERDSKMVVNPTVPSSTYEEIQKNVDGISESTSSTQSVKDFVSLTDNSIRETDLSLFDPFFPEIHTVPPKGGLCTQHRYTCIAAEAPSPGVSGAIHDFQKYSPTSSVSTPYQQEDDTSSEIKFVSEDSDSSYRMFDVLHSPTPSHIVVPTGNIAAEPTAEHNDDGISFAIESAVSAKSCAHGGTQESPKWTPQSVLTNFEICHPQLLGHNPPSDPTPQYHKHPAVGR